MKVNAGLSQGVSLENIGFINQFDQNFLEYWVGAKFDSSKQSSKNDVE